MELLGGFPVETLGDQLEGAGIGRHLHRHVYGVVKSDQVSAHAQPAQEYSAFYILAASKVGDRVKFVIGQTPFSKSRCKGASMTGVDRAASDPLVDGAHPLLDSIVFQKLYVRKRGKLDK